MKNTFLTLFVFFALFNLKAQIPSGYYDGTEGLMEEQLKSALHDIIKNHTEYSYSDLKWMLKETDEDPNNSNNIILLYTGRSQAKNTFGGGANDWNREHVWAKSHGGFGTSAPAGTDAHHLRPTDASVNSSRGNKDFDNGGQQHSEATGCYYTSDTWEARDEVKGDVARMIFYMAVRYEGGNGEPDLEVVDYVGINSEPKHGKLSTLLEWNEQDPPDAFEINRNEVIYGYQHNRNPFIDHPEFVNKIWDPEAIIINPSEAQGVVVFPNPVMDKIQIETSSKIDQVEIFDIYGKINRNWKADDNNEYIDTSALPSGIYFVKVYSAKQQFVKKFVKL